MKEILKKGGIIIYGHHFFSIVSSKHSGGNFYNYHLNSNRFGASNLSLLFWQKNVRERNDILVDTNKVLNCTKADPPALVGNLCDYRNCYHLLKKNYFPRERVFFRKDRNLNKNINDKF